MQSLNLFLLATVLASTPGEEEDSRVWTFKKTHKTFSGEFIAFEDNHVFVETNIGTVAIRPRDLTRRDVKYYRNILQSASKERARIYALKISQARLGNKRHVAMNPRNKAYCYVLSVNTFPVAYFLGSNRNRQDCANYFRAVNARCCH